MTVYFLHLMYAGYDHRLSEAMLRIEIARYGFVPGWWTVHSVRLSSLQLGRN